MHRGYTVCSHPKLYPAYIKVPKESITESVACDYHRDTLHDAKAKFAKTVPAV